MMKESSVLCARAGIAIEDLFQSRIRQFNQAQSRQHILSAEICTDQQQRLEEQSNHEEANESTLLSIENQECLWMDQVDESQMIMAMEKSENWIKRITSKAYPITKILPVRICYKSMFLIF